MRYALKVDPDTLVDARIAQIEGRLSMQLVQLEIRVIKWMFICMIIIFALVMVLALPTLRGLALGLFLAGSRHPGVRGVAMVGRAGGGSLSEDAADLAAFKARADEPSLAFEVVLKDLNRRGKL